MESDEGPRVSPGALRPSQLYVSAEKLAAVLERVESAGGGHEFGPLPVYDFDGVRRLTDGHTRALAAHLTGAESVQIEYDDDLAEEYNIELYCECIESCVTEGIERIPDLVGRVLGPDEFEREWIDRCDSAAERLGAE